MGHDEPKAGEQKPGTGAIVNRLLDAAEKDDERKEREHANTVAVLERSQKLWFRISMALIGVLSTLVTGIIGILTTGHIPGTDFEIHRASDEVESSDRESVEVEEEPPVVEDEVMAPEDEVVEPSDAAEAAGVVP